MAVTDLDRELSEAVDAAVPGAPVAGVDAASVRGVRSAHASSGGGRASDRAFVVTSQKRERQRGSPIVLGVLLAFAVGIVALVMTSFKNAAVYAKSVDEVVGAETQLAGRRLRVEGMLVHGSLVRREQPCEHRFEIQKGGKTLAVRYPQCVVPDSFRDYPEVDVAVTVEGALRPEGDFEATLILAKCPSKYEMKNKSGDGRSMGSARDLAPRTP